MMKMIIRMNDYKIAKDNQYSLQDIYNTLNHMFFTVGLPRIESEANTLTYVMVVQKILTCLVKSLMF